MTGPVRVRWSEPALARLVAYLAHTTPGVAWLQPNLVRRIGSAARGSLARERGADASAVSVAFAADGALELSVRIVTRLAPTPIDCVAALTSQITEEVEAVTGQPVRVFVEVTNVVP